MSFVSGKAIRGAIGSVAFLALLECLSRFASTSSFGLPPISEILVTLFDEAKGSDFWIDIGRTMYGWSLGLGLAITIGIPAGLLFGSSPVTARAFRAPLEFLRPIPSVALIPLAILFFGGGTEGKVLLVAYAATWPILVQTAYGIKEVDAIAQDTGRAFRLSWQDRTRYIVLPSALPFMLTGIRISGAIALALGVSIEYVVGSPGLGSAINAAEAGGDTRSLYGMVIVAGVLGLLINRGLLFCESHLLRWRPANGLAS
jgi:ABC-type nitrate/sulfonate/bicarbonate transport system permease component